MHAASAARTAVCGLALVCGAQLLLVPCFASAQNAAAEPALTAPAVTAPAAPAAAPALPGPGAAPAAPAAAGSASSVVFLKNGGLLRGELMELQPGTLVRMKLADGTVRDLPWAEVDRITDPSLPPDAPRVLDLDAATAAVGAGAVGQPAPATLSPEVAGKIARLRAERAEINSAVPGVAIYVGGTYAATFGLGGLLALAIGCRDRDSGDEAESDRDCEERMDSARLLAAIGGVAAVGAIVGLVIVLDNHSQRKAIDARIRELERRERSALRLDVQPLPRGGALALTGRW